MLLPLYVGFNPLLETLCPDRILLIHVEIIAGDGFNITCTDKGKGRLKKIQPPPFLKREI